MVMLFIKGHEDLSSGENTFLNTFHGNPCNVVDILQTGPKQWTDRQIVVAIPTATPPAWLLNWRGERKRKINRIWWTHNRFTDSALHSTTFKAGLSVGQVHRQTEIDAAGDQAANRNRQRNIKAAGPKIPSRRRVLLSPSSSSAPRHGLVCFSCSLPPSYHHMDRAASIPVYLIKHNLYVLLFPPMPARQTMYIFGRV